MAPSGQSEDFNFWGVTFSAEDSNRFYATVRSAGKTYLLEGDVGERTMTVLRENVECPSLSPDGTRIAFKKLTDGLIGQWRLHVLDLATMEQTAAGRDAQHRRSGRVARRPERPVRRRPGHLDRAQ